VNLWRRVNVLERKLTHVTSVTGAGDLPEVVITGANLRLVNGLRATATTNGLGNLLVGYNESREGENVRTGSHNVVVGQGHNFSSFGGLVVGRQNEISGAFAAVSGGFDNTASGASAAVSGGIFNRARGASAAVSGGFDNTASANATAVCGGQGNTASGLPRRSVGAKRTRPAALPPPSAAGATTRLVGTSTGSPGSLCAHKERPGHRGGPSRWCGSWVEPTQVPMSVQEVVAMLGTPGAYRHGSKQSKTLAADPAQTAGILTRPRV
jgi:hypothetical protein